MNKYRSHNCGELTKKDVNREVKLSGWVHRRRDHGSLVFIDLRDHFGITQITIDQNSPIIDKISRLHHESVITISGKVVARSTETINENIATGEIEVLIEHCDLISDSQILPIQVNSNNDFPEETRLKYRFLDLRREKLHSNIVLRSKVISKIRELMNKGGFMEFQTPILTASSPEGARDFLVPSRIHPGKFYALPQAPQIFKQLLMVSGFDRYFQIAPCFRDEDARADRSPGEFYQLDIEMSFVEQDDVFAAVEPIMHQIFTQFSNKKVSSAPFVRIKFDEAMLKYGSDKPDLRNPIEIVDVTNIFADSSFKIFVEAIKNKAIVRAIPAPKSANKPRSFFDKMIAFAQENGAKGLAYITYDENGVGGGPIAKFLSNEQHESLKSSAKLEPGDAVFFASDSELKAAKLAGIVRKKIGEDLELIDDKVFNLCWITDFPFYEWDEDRNLIDFSHNPFSMPQGGLEVLENSKSKEELLKIRAFQYDLVCNGVELSSGAIRNHDLATLYKAFEIVGYGKEVIEARFGCMVNAFKYGPPPHGGIAPGIDRIVMLLADEPNIREVICFPMNQQAEDLMMNAPSTVDEKQLRELGIMIRAKANK
jgi:aspartyl-tRNA synthetase